MKQDFYQKLELLHSTLPKEQKLVLTILALFSGAASPAQIKASIQVPQDTSIFQLLI